MMRLFLLAIFTCVSLGLFNWAFGSRVNIAGAPTRMKLLVTDWTESFRLYHQPHAIWLSDYDFVGANRKVLNLVLAKATQYKQNPELVIYAIPRRDLGQSSEGGFSSMDTYWEDNQLNAKLIKVFVKQTGLNPRVYLEPDALSLAVQYRIDNHDNAESMALYQARTQIISRLIKLYKDAGAIVYLDAAHSDWFDYDDEHIRWMSQALNDAGIADADGLVTNVSNRQKLKNREHPDERSEWHYIGRLLPRLQNRHLDVVVDTSRNGGVTKPRQYFLAPNGLLIDNELSTGRLVGTWKKDEDGQVRLFTMFGKPKTLGQLLKKEKYQYNVKKSILIAPKWLDPIFDVKPGPPPTDAPPQEVADRIHRLRYVKPPDDCDGVIHCPPGHSKQHINEKTQARQQPDVQVPPDLWLPL